MPLKDYYLILGVSRSDNPAAIRAAYRDRAKSMHPDHAGSGGTAAFQELAEAYEVLSDVRRRRSYDQQLRLASEQASAPAPVLRRPFQPEPFIPRANPLFRRTEQIRPSFEEMYHRMARNFTGAGVPKAERPEALNLEVVLSPEEAMRGGDLPVGVPLLQTCRFCHGSGNDWMFVCSNCRGQGVIEHQKTVYIRIPPFVGQGAVIEVPLDGLGIGNFFLRAHIAISG